MRYVRLGGNRLSRIAGTVLEGLRRGKNVINRLPAAVSAAEVVGKRGAHIYKTIKNKIPYLKNVAAAFSGKGRRRARRYANRTRRRTSRRRRRRRRRRR